jgi:hypothetical protein
VEPGQATDNDGPRCQQPGPVWHHSAVVFERGNGTGFLVVVVLVVGAVCGCSQQAPRASHDHPSASATALTTASLAGWRKLGATEVPPASLRQVSLGAAQVVNQTQGAVSDADARAWADAFMRTFAYLRWAVARGQDQFLFHSGLSSAPLKVFQPNVNDIAAARSAGDRVEYTLQVFRRLVVRAVAPSLQARIEGAGYVWKPYAIYLDAVGPVETDWIDAQGNRTVKFQAPPGAPLFELLGGDLIRDPLMGDVWDFSFDFDCTAASSQQVLAPLCNP